MRCFVRLQATFSRLLILVVLAAALFPALGHAFAPGKSAELAWVEVCTVGGIETRNVFSGDSEPSAPALLVEHCPYCLVSSFDDTFPAAPGPALVPASGPDAALPVLDSSAVSVATWPAALPRAPPVAV